MFKIVIYYMNVKWGKLGFHRVVYSISLMNVFSEDLKYIV